MASMMVRPTTKVMTICESAVVVGINGDGEDDRKDGMRITTHT